MRIVVVSVGKPRRTDLDAIHDDYAERIRRLRVEYSQRHAPDQAPASRLDTGPALEREARAVLELLPSSGTLIALDPAGEAPDSPGLARSLERWANPHATFVIGGPRGLGAPVLERATARLSLSRLTFPHELTRVLLAEQLYRSITLLRGLPYHK